MAKMKIIPRRLEDHLKRLLKAFPAVYLAGPRQSGKTTLVKSLASRPSKASYFTFDDAQLRSSVAQGPEDFLNSLEGLTVLDEVQAVPELFRPLKMIIDQRRARGKGQGQFLLTGSAHIMARPELSDALVGRMALTTLFPFSSCELTPHQGQDFIARAFHRQWPLREIKKKDPSMFLKASFPELLSLSPPLRPQWCRDYLSTLLRRDVRELLDIHKLATFPDMLHFFASQPGGILNKAALSRATELNHITTKKYRSLLEHLFLTLSIPAWAPNLGKRVIKSPKVYLGDLNLLFSLLNTTPEEVSQRDPSFWGKIIENFVAIELSKQLAFSSVDAKLFHYRATSGQEVDFVLEGPDRKIVIIEVKSSEHVHPKQIRHLQAMREGLAERFHRGFVFYQGKKVIPWGKGLFLIPMEVLWSQATSRSERGIGE